MAIFQHREHHSLNKINIHQFNYIFGPYNINKNHWVAVIINMTSREFQVINPKGNSVTLSQNCLEAWVQYYNSRNDVSIEK